MTDQKAYLIAKYLAGDASEDEIRRLNQVLLGNSQAAEALLSEAQLDVQLREILSNSALGVAVAKETTSTGPAVKRPVARWMAAALFVAAISGWIVAAYTTRDLDRARANVNTLESRVAELENASTESQVAQDQLDGPTIHSMRGWLMTSIQRSNTSNATQMLQVGTTAPLDQKLWTCPWGATEFRYNGGVSISVERNTAFEFNEANGGRQLTLAQGIVHVNNLSKTDRLLTEIKCALATVRLRAGQVAVQVDEQQTSVEAAVHRIKVFVDHEDRTYTIERGQYLIITPGERTKVVDGMLNLGLEAPDR